MLFEALDSRHCVYLQHDSYTSRCRIGFMQPGIFRDLSARLEGSWPVGYKHSEAIK